jgi:formate dehydrogenase maturation protein FdhE
VAETWQLRIDRARELARADETTGSLLSFYADLLTAQARAFASLRDRLGRTPTGSLERDLLAVRDTLPLLLRTVATTGPQPLVAEARSLGASEDAAVNELLLSDWRAPSGLHFFAKATLQPYAAWLAELKIDPIDRQLTPAINRCPFCRGAPQLSILQSASDADGGGRLLQCATCLGKWPFRRVVCASCGEEDDRKLAYFHTEAFDHLRVDACESCRRYLKSVDLTRMGLAVPLVDEAGGATLDVWARERGYEKIELNLLGL